MWNLRRILLRAGYLRPIASNNRRQAPHRVDLVHDADEDTYGALRRFVDRRQRSAAIALITAGAPVTPVLLDVVDDPSVPPSIVTSWAAGGSDVLLERLSEADDLAYLLELGSRWAPAQALRALVPLGHALDALAQCGFSPIELSPDHLIYNSGNIRLVGIGRHLYHRDANEFPDASGMSLPTTLLLGEDYPAASTSMGVWRAAQMRALLRLAGWMACGLPPAAWGSVSSTDDLHRYLKYAGFTEVPGLTPSNLAKDLADAADREEDRAAKRRLATAAAVLVYDDEECGATGETIYEWLSSYESEWLTATVIEVDKDMIKTRIDVPGGEPWSVRVPWQATPKASLRRYGRVDLCEHYTIGETVTVQLREILLPFDGGRGRWPRTKAEVVNGTGTWMRPRQRARVDVNAESVRLGLLHEHGPSVIAVAAFNARKMGARASFLSGAGWVLVQPDQLPQVVAHFVQINPHGRYMVAGRPSDRLADALRSVTPEIVIPSSASLPPQIACRPAVQLPYIDDPDLQEFRKLLPPTAGSSFRRRTFAAAWAHSWEEDDGHPGSELNRAILPKQLRRMAELFGTDTELLVRIGTFLRRPGNLGIDHNRLDANLERAATVLRGVPAHGKFRRDLLSALLGTTYEDLYRVVTQRLLPVAFRLADTYDPNLPLGGRRMDENLFDQPGVRRLGLFGRLVTALPDDPPSNMAEVVSQLDDELVTALADIPAPSLQYLVGRLGSPALLEKLRRLISDPDLDLLTRYTPAAWRLLLDGLRQPEFLGVLGLGWALVVERDQSGTVDARVLARLASDSGQPTGYIVRALLDTPVGSWPAILARPRLASRWLDRFGTLDIATVLAAYPDAEALATRIGLEMLRAAAATGIDGGRLDLLINFARTVGVSPDIAIGAFLSSGLGVDQLSSLTGSAASAWIAQKTAAGADLVQTIVDLVDNPRILRTWAVEGRRLGRRILADILGTGLDQLHHLEVEEKEGRELIQVLELQPGLVDLCSRVIFPRQRLTLLRLAAADPDRTLVHPAVADALPEVLDEPDPNDALNQILNEGMSLTLIARARELHLDHISRRLLPPMGPLATILNQDDVSTLVELGRVEGPGFVAEAAQLEHQLSGTIRLLSRWGVEWLPVLAGPEGRRVAAHLAMHDPVDPAWLTPWLLASGHSGIQSLARHGETLLDFLAKARPPVADVLVVDELLTYEVPHVELYRLVVTFGLPRETWRHVASWLARDEDDESILLRLWDSKTAALAKG